MRVVGFAEVTPIIHNLCCAIAKLCSFSWCKNNAFRDQETDLQVAVIGGFSNPYFTLILNSKIENKLGTVTFKKQQFLFATLLNYMKEILMVKKSLV